MQRKIGLLTCILSFTCMAHAENIPVKNAAELSQANKQAKPGDVIIMQNGIWNDITIGLNCKGTKAKPIYVKAQTPGSVRITGKSKLMLGGDYIIVDGLYFTNGYAGDDAIITYRMDKKQLANNCRLTNTVIDDFNNPKRLDENYWIAFYGKNNRLDNCSFYNKKNIGVLLAVILDDDRSRENFHSIDHNYFGFRRPLASNGGEMIRVGVSQHCEFNSNTQITDNIFEHCDGETEIISIKSASNIIRNNIFKECQGAVVLRHGNFNTVENNIFLGNNKPGTGGVRIINKGQWVVNNYFYQCRGTGFRSPLSVMNGVPNSPAFRYVTASDAVVANNSFIECAPMTFCEGADTERSERPFNIYVLNNFIKNNHDSVIYQSYDDLSGFRFSGNLVTNNNRQPLLPGFLPAALPGNSLNKISDSLQASSIKRLGKNLSSTPGYKGYNPQQLKLKTGAVWFTYHDTKFETVYVNCKTAEEIISQLEKYKNKALTINLTSPGYQFTKPLDIAANTIISSTQKSPIRFSFTILPVAYFIQVIAGKTLSLENINLDLSKMGAAVFITTDTSGSTNHSDIKISNAQFSGLGGNFLNAAKSTITGNVIISGSGFRAMKGTLFNFSNETDKKGYYNVEHLIIRNNSFENNTGPLLTMLRGGNDESTMGPILTFTGNTISNCNAGEPLIYLYGTQYSTIEKNTFTGSNKNATLIKYEDVVRAMHIFRDNSSINSGDVVDNKYVIDKDNRVN